MVLNNEKPMIITEIGMNHEGSFGQAKCLIKAAADSGAGAVKFQLHISQAETLKNAPKPKYFTEESRFEYFDRTAFSKEQWIKLKEYSKSLGVYFIVSPFSKEATEILVEIDVDAIKIPSGEVTNIPYIEHIAKTGMPIIISSGMSTYEELDLAIATLKKYTDNINVMQCTSEYPCLPESVGLNVLDELKERYNIPIGFSDHTTNIWVSIVAAYKGANLIERHFTLSQLMYGPDAKMSLEPNELKELCNAIDFIYQAKKSPIDKNDIEKFKFMKTTFQKSIVTEKEIKAGDVINEDMISLKKPGTGLEPKYYYEVIGKKVKKDLAAGITIQREDIQW